MKIERAGIAARKLRALPMAIRADVAKAIEAGTEEGARIARTLAPNQTGRTRAEIHTEYRDGGMVGEVVVIDSGAPRAEKDRAYSIEHGRKAGAHGTTEGYHFVKMTRAYMAKKNRARVKRAINKAVKRVSGNG